MISILFSRCRKCRNKVLPLILVLLLSGCSLFDPLPEGKPPQGDILHNTAPKNFNVSSAVNYMTTSLSIHLLTNPLPENVLAVDADLNILVHALSVVEEISRVTGIKRKNLPCSQILKARIKKNSWEFSLEVKGKTVWKEQLLLTLVSEKQEPPVQVEKR